ncbi:MAG: TolC family protein [Bacteroidia bacterium]|nr:TolC family protein [Bacteroidia bacterium]
MNRILLCLLAGMLSGLTALAQQPSGETLKMSLEDCIEYALKGNYNRQSVELNESTNLEAYKQSKLELLPSVNASLSEGYSNSKSVPDAWSGNYNLNASVTLFQGGTIINTIQQNKLKLEQSTYQTTQYDNQLTIKILQAFLTVLGNEELLKYQSAVVKASEEQMKQGEEQFNAGSILESDYLLLKAQYSNDKNNITDTRITRDNSLLSLKNLLSIHPDENLEIIYPDTSALVKMSALPQMNYVMEQALSTLPDIKISQYNVDIAISSVKLAKSGYYPTLSLSGSIGTGHQNDYSNFGTQLSNGFNQQIGLSLSIPIFDKNRTKVKVVQSRIALQKAELNAKQTELDIMQDVTTEYQDVVSAYNKYQTTDIRQNAYLKTFDAYSIKFNAGAITAVELLQQQNNYISALNDYIQSKYNFMLKRKILDVYMGNPVTM